MRRTRLGAFGQLVLNPEPLFFHLRQRPTVDLLDRRPQIENAAPQHMELIRAITLDQEGDVRSAGILIDLDLKLELPGDIVVSLVACLAKLLNAPPRTWSVQGGVDGEVDRLITAP